MSKGIDLVPLLQWVTQQQAFKKEDKPQRTKVDKPKSFEELWMEEKKRRAQFDDFMNMMKKQNAEEAKKDDKKGWSIDTIAMFLMTMMPLNWAVMYLLLNLK